MNLCKESTKYTIVEVMTCGGYMTIPFSLWNNHRARCLLLLVDYNLFISRLMYYTKAGASCIVSWADNIQHLHWPTSYSHAVEIISSWIFFTEPFERTLQDLVAIRVQVDPFSVSVCQVYESKMKWPEVEDHLLLKYSGYLHNSKNSYFK